MRPEGLDGHILRDQDGVPSTVAQRVRQTQHEAGTCPSILPGIPEAGNVFRGGQGAEQADEGNALSRDEAAHGSTLLSL
jgi:hypothetical protein